MAAREALIQGAGWERASLDAIAEGTWRNPATNAAERSKLLTVRPSALVISGCHLHGSPRHHFTHSGVGARMDTLSPGGAL
eukprot:3732160-Lingulodinium_polyedra.AAC.1